MCAAIAWRVQGLTVARCVVQVLADALIHAQDDATRRALVDQLRVLRQASSTLMPGVARASPVVRGTASAWDSDDGSVGSSASRRATVGPPRPPPTQQSTGGSGGGSGSGGGGRHDDMAGEPRPPNPPTRTARSATQTPHSPRPVGSPVSLGSVAAALHGGVPPPSPRSYHARQRVASVATPGEEPSQAERPHGGRGVFDTNGSPRVPGATVTCGTQTPGQADNLPPLPPMRLADELDQCVGLCAWLVCGCADVWMWNGVGT